MDFSKIYESCLREGEWGFDNGAYWYYDGQYFYLGEDEFHHQFLVRNAREFDLYFEIQEIAAEFGYDYDLDGFAEALDLPEGVSPDEAESPIECVPDKVLMLAHSKGAIRVRPASGHIFINCPKFNKKVIDNLMNLILDDEKNFKSTTIIYIEQTTGDFDSDYKNRIKANGKTEAINLLLEV